MVAILEDPVDTRRIQRIFDLVTVIKLTGGVLYRVIAINSVEGCPNPYPAQMIFGDRIDIIVIRQFINQGEIPALGIVTVKPPGSTYINNPCAGFTKSDYEIAF